MAVLNTSGVFSPHDTSVIVWHWSTQSTVYPLSSARSALTDCQRLANAGFKGSLAILIYGYEYEGYPLEPAIRAFGTSDDSHTVRKRLMALAQLVAMRVDAWTAGYVVACAALHEVRLVRMPQ